MSLRSKLSILICIIFLPYIGFAHKKEIKPSELKQKYNTEEFNYKIKEQKPEKQSEPIDTNLNSPSFTFLKDVNWNFVMYGILGTAFLIVFFVMYRRGLFVQYKTNHTHYIDEGKNFDYIENNLLEVNLNDLIKQAISEQNYRLAVRYYHYQNTQNLARKGFIIWDKKKTNHQLANQISKEEIKRLFIQNTGIFNQVWFGNVAIDQSLFQTFEANFNFLNQSL